MTPIFLIIIAGIFILLNIAATYILYSILRDKYIEQSIEADKKLQEAEKKLIEIYNESYAVKREGTGNNVDKN